MTRSCSGASKRGATRSRTSSSPTAAWWEAPAVTASPGRLGFHGVVRELEGTLAVDPRPDGSIIVTGDHAFDIRDFDIASPTVLMLRIYPDVSVKLQVEAVPIDEGP